MDLVKLIFRDNERDIALTGTIISEDDYFFKFQTIKGDIILIGKKFVIAVKPIHVKE